MYSSLNILIPRDGEECQTPKLPDIALRTAQLAQRQGNEALPNNVPPTPDFTAEDVPVRLDDVPEVVVRPHNLAVQWLVGAEVGGLV